MNLRFRFFVFAVMLTTLLIAASPAHAQNHASIRGTVTDRPGAVIPGATVTITNQATAVTESTTTTSAGLYVFSKLPPGNYTLVVEAMGFQTSKIENVTALADQVQKLNLTLEVGTADHRPGPSSGEQGKAAVSRTPIPWTSAPPQLDCDGDGFQNGAMIVLSKDTGKVFQLFPFTQFASAPPEVQQKLSQYKATYKLLWDHKNLYGRIDVQEQSVDEGHPSFPTQSVYPNSTGGVLLPDLFYDTAVLNIFAPGGPGGTGTEGWVTEMHLYIRPPGARSPHWVFLGRTGGEEDFHSIEGDAVACQAKDGFSVKFAASWLPFGEWEPVAGAHARLVLMAPLPFSPQLSLKDRATKAFILGQNLPVILKK